MGTNESNGAVAPFRCEISWEEGTLVVKAFGEIDLASAPLLESAIESRKRSASQVVVDLSHVRYLDTAAVNTLVRGRRRFEEDGDFRVVLATDQAIAMKMFEITKLVEYLGVETASPGDGIDRQLAAAPTK